MTNSAASLKNFCIYLLIFPANLGFTAGVIYLKSLVLQSNDGIKFCLLAAKDSAFTYVRTKKNTWVILSMKDGTRSKLTPESELQIKRCFRCSGSETYPRRSIHRSEKEIRNKTSFHPSNKSYHYGGSRHSVFYVLRYF